MYSNISTWDILTAAEDVGKVREPDSPTAGLVEGASGAAAGVVFLIAVAILVRKYLANLRDALEALEDILTRFTNAVRKLLPIATPPPPPTAVSPRNLTDSELIEMRYDDAARYFSQADRDAPRSVWI